MPIFDNGQADLVPFSDEELFAQSEQQEQGQPPADKAEESPATQGEEVPGKTVSQTEAEAAATPADTDGQVAEEKQDNVEELRQQIQQLAKQNSAAISGMNKAQQELASERKRREALEQGLNYSVPKEPKEREAFLQELVENPNQVLGKLVEQAAEAKVQQVMAPLLERQREAAWNSAWAKTAEHWPELGQSGQALVMKMKEISQTAGDRDLMFKQPERIMQMAALELLGIPVKVDSKAIEAAVRQAKENTVKELSATNAAKGGLTAAQRTNAQNSEPPTPEEQIIQDIFKVGGGGIFNQQMRG